MESNSTDTIQAYPNFDSDFKVLRKLGGGNYGVVLLILQKSTQRQLALKIFLGEDQDKLINMQAEVMANYAIFSQQCQLAPLTGIPAYYGVFRVTSSQLSIDQDYYLSLYEAPTSNSVEFLGIFQEYIEGIDLGAYIFDLQKKGEVLSKRSFCSLAREITRTVFDLHQRGFAHRDIKPDNMILTPTGQIFLVDLGFTCLSRKVTGCQNVKVDMCSGHVGSMFFLAPEILRTGTSQPPTNLDPEDMLAADLYSLGCTFFSLINLIPPGNPFQADYTTPVLKQRCYPRMLRGDMDEITEICNRLVTDDIQSRGTASQLLNYFNGEVARYGLIELTQPFDAWYPVLLEVRSR